MPSRIEIIDADLVETRRDLLSLIDHWKSVLGIKIGWHYDLDLIWIMEKLESLRLPPGAKILDAGAGTGLLQFLLAAKGFEVTSADFADRDVPWAAARIFSVEMGPPAGPVGKHTYQDFIHHRKPMLNLKTLRRHARHPFRTLRKIGERLWLWCNPARWRESGCAGRYGKIIYRKADFSDMSAIPAGAYDCVVSVSAIEHNNPEGIQKAVGEFARITKRGGHLIVTTSAARDADWYMESCQGWCFTGETLARIFSVDSASHNFSSYDGLFRKLVESRTIRKRIPRLYYENGDNGLPWGEYPPKYQPVGVIKTV